MPRLPLSSHGRTPHERLLGHNPVILGHWLALEGAFFGTDTFDDTLREQVRRTLAFKTECEYCMARAGPPETAGGPGRLGLAVAFAQVAGADHRDVGDAHLSMLREEFSEKEIAELVAFICFITASQMFGAMMGLGAADLPAPVTSPAAADRAGAGDEDLHRR